MKKIFYLIILTIAISACKKSNDKNTSDTSFLMPNTTGKAGDMIIVMSDEIWKTSVGDSIFDVLTQDYPALPQSEPTLKVSQIPPKAFGDMFKTHRNILMIKIDKDYKKNKLEIKYDIWAHPQIVINIESPDTKSFLKIWRDSSQMIVNKVVNYEIKRIADGYRKYQESSIMQEIIDKYGVSLVVPKGYSLDVKRDDFAWIAHETPKTSQGIFVYYYPYYSKKQLTLNSLIGKRDSILMINVPGPNDGSFMTTEKRIKIYYKAGKKDDIITIDMKGLWYTEGAFMGGPFVSRTMLDTVRNRIVVVDGFVYAGKLEKKLFLWQVLAIVRSMKLVEEK